MPTEVTYINELGYASNTNVLAYKMATDQTLHWADPLGAMCHEEMVMGALPSDVCAHSVIATDESTRVSSSTASA